MKNKLLFQFCLCLFAANLISCSEELTEKEKQTVHQFTKQEEHDSCILGKWRSIETFVWKGQIRKTVISFDGKGVNNERMYEGGKPFNDWHFVYYFYTKQGKIFMYRPAEKGFLAMDGEIFIEYKYKVSKDGKLLTIGNLIYTRVDKE